MKEQYPIEFNEMVKDFLDGVMNDFDMNYPNAPFSDREVRTKVKVASCVDE